MAELTYVRDENGPINGDVVWVFELGDRPDVRLIRVLNPRWETDGDEGGLWNYPAYDSWTIDGREPTEDESDEVTDMLHNELHAYLSQT